jgi:hypothetical protein
VELMLSQRLQQASAGGVNMYCHTPLDIYQHNNSETY